MVQSNRNYERKITVKFFKTSTGNEPVRDWLAKKTQKTPTQDLDLAKKRRDIILTGGNSNE
jgi:phage-related protein